MKPTVWKTMIFDLDGVLFRSSRAHESAYRHVLRSIGITRFDYEEISGMRTTEAFKKVLKSRSISYTPQNLKEWVDLKREMAYHELQNDPPIYPRCKTILQRLRGAFDLSLVSSSSRRNIQLFLKASGTKKLIFRGSRGRRCSARQTVAGSLPVGALPSQTHTEGSGHY